MRTTLAIDDDVLLVARDLARQQRRSIGEVVSDLARRSLRSEGSDGSSQTTRNGFVLLPVNNPAAVITMEMVNSLRDELE
ncbi:hypothetical protein [Sphingomonas sp. 10B4]|jgi:negative regulator of replication initiation|uniref:hypothetical protein n=1 Tax=Sphingomonas sp. 10B4 TaxID=3048575 RepID=UPI002AB40904|nr:hypothetical protein [Sphingomonas sp. 10B4]MDY7522741.1 hypothetical protein [Sphingomonas sp. 10B4]MEB0284481.1 hypothetical protein [Sphingomonas sp. 10B4]